MPLVFLLYALFASVFTITKVGLEYAPPLFLVGTRMLLAGFILLGYEAIRNPDSLKLKKSHFLPLAILAIFNIYLTNVLEFWGLQYMTSFKTCFFYSLSPFAAALLSYLILAERLTLKKWLGLLIGFIGMGPIILMQGSDSSTISELSIISLPELAVLGAALSSVYGWITMKQMVNTHKISPMACNGYSMLLGGIFALSHSSFVENWDPLPVTEMLPFLCALAGTLIISNLICYNLYGFLLRRFSATFMSFAGFTTPIFTAFYGWIFLNETVTLPFLLSVTIVFMGLLLFHQEELRYMVRPRHLPQQ